MPRQPKGNTHLSVPSPINPRRNVKRRDNIARVIDCLHRKRIGLLQWTKVTKGRGLILDDIVGYTGIPGHNLERNIQRYIRKLSELGFLEVGEIVCHVGRVVVFYPTDKLWGMSLNAAKSLYWDKGVILDNDDDS